MGLFDLFFGDDKNKKDFYDKDYEPYNFEEEELEDDDYYYEDDNEE